jgi:diguanylate cyclase (GGDEF)-like protein
MTRAAPLFRDTLTGLFVNAYFIDRLSEAVEADSNGEPTLALLIVDLDDLFLINITRGRAGGDQVLKELAAILNNAARADDVVGRLGADQFAVLLPGMQLEPATQYAEALRKMVWRAHAEGRSSCPIDVCIGVSATAPDHPQFAEALLHTADRRLDAAKRSRRSPGFTRHVWAGPVDGDDSDW